MCALNINNKSPRVLFAWVPYPPVPQELDDNNTCNVMKSTASFGDRAVKNIMYCDNQVFMWISGLGGLKMIIWMRWLRRATWQRHLYHFRLERIKSKGRLERIFKSFWASAAAYLRVAGRVAITEEWGLRSVTWLSSSASSFSGCGDTDTLCNGEDVSGIRIFFLPP